MSVNLTQYYLMEASWAWFRAQGENEDLLSALHRTKAERVKRQMEEWGIPVPSLEEVLAYAESRWPAHRLHSK